MLQVQEWVWGERCWGLGTEAIALLLHCNHPSITHCAFLLH